jgi:Ni,Fe-hydrogenase I large subunit
MEVSGQLHAPVALLPGKEPHSTYWIGGWVDPRTDLKDQAKIILVTVRMEIYFYRNADESTPPALSRILR